MADAPSREYVAALRATTEHHATSKGKTFSGAFIFKRRFIVKAIVDRLKVKTFLDYGCGYGKQYIPNEQGQTLESFLGFATAKFDPAVEHYKREPEGQFDMTSCVQILNCIPKKDLPWLADRLYGLTTKAIFISERLGYSRKGAIIHAGMEALLPYDYTADDYLAVFRRPGSPVRLIMEFKDGDGGWVAYEPEDQGVAQIGAGRAGIVAGAILALAAVGAHFTIGKVAVAAELVAACL